MPAYSSLFPENVMGKYKVNFKGSLESDLSGVLDKPDSGEILAYAIFAHCFTCNKDYRAVRNISKALNEEGIAVLRFDFAGLGDSAGDFSETNFSSNMQDLYSAAEFLEGVHAAPNILIGHSMGGAAVLKAAANITSVKVVATIATPYNPLDLKEKFSYKMEELETSGEMKIQIGPGTYRLKKQFFDDLRENSDVNYISGMNKPLLIFHSPLDNIVDISNAEKIFFAASHPKSFIALDTADHLLNDESDSLYVGGVIAAWARKYL